MNENIQNKKESDHRSHYWKTVSLCMDVRKIKDWAGCDWQELSELAHKMIVIAIWYLNKKNYRMFGLYLRLFTDLWQFASDQLSQEDYRYFCCSQSSVAVAGIQ